MKTSTTDFLMNALFVHFICVTCVTFTIQAQRPPSVRSQVFPELREQIKSMVQEAEELRALGKHEAAEQTMNRARRLRSKLAERLEQELEQTHHRTRELGGALEHAHRRIEEK